MSTASILVLHLPRAAKVLPQFAAQFDPTSSLTLAARTGNIYRMLAQVADLQSEYSDLLSALRSYRRFDCAMPRWLDPETRESLENVESLAVLGEIGKSMVELAR